MVAGPCEDCPALRLIDGLIARNAFEHDEAEVLFEQDLPAKIAAIALKTLLNLVEGPVGTIALEDAKRERRVRSIPSGKVVLKPRWKTDYVALVSQYLKQTAARNTV